VVLRRGTCRPNRQCCAVCCILRISTTTTTFRVLTTSSARWIPAVRTHNLGRRTRRKQPPQTLKRLTLRSLEIRFKAPLHPVISPLAGKMSPQDTPSRYQNIRYKSDLYIDEVPPLEPYVRDAKQFPVVGDDQESICIDNGTPSPLLPLSPPVSYVYDRKDHHTSVPGSLRMRSHTSTSRTKRRASPRGRASRWRSTGGTVMPTGMQRDM
jgi:hypothetical protein